MTNGWKAPVNLRTPVSLWQPGSRIRVIRTANNTGPGRAGKLQCFITADLQINLHNGFFLAMGEAEKRQRIKEAQQQQRQIRPCWREQGPHTEKWNQSTNDFQGVRDSLEFSGFQIWSVASNWPIKVVCHPAAQGCCAQRLPACLS